MGTNWKKSALSNYSIVRIAEGESGYNYYCYSHPMGQIIIAREDIAGTEYKYADGGFNLNIAWTTRASFIYKDLAEL